MKIKAAFALFGLLGAIVSCNTETKEEQASVGASVEVDSVELVKRGGYLVTVGGCNDCHSPKVMTAHGPAPDTSRLLSGYDPSRPFVGFDKATALSGTMVVFNIESTAAAGPWGISYAANLTPDDTGIGSWTFEQFRRAMKEGKWKGLEDSRPLLPPMPWPNFKDVGDEDLAAIFAYLKSIKPVNNPIPAPVTPDAI
ncbi:diheme cytochrome c-553 [Parapedobacter koreensis]|uniref:Cytochrome c domain-containing protein n=1 Tax=Parapedobacter koreensis TaxID=332977 RepID=A0A1H7TKQ4_9SPHI|nr:diheme cytochrome c-553 [Parapedobacter koreensis]SEL85059.1 hypothetical protein SAMN05421740_111112 [Parapedobacter koreensis]